VIDCRPAQRIKPRDAEAFAATEAACEQVGWEYRLVSGHDPVSLANLRWLAGYRHPRNFQPVVADQLLDAFASPAAVIETAEQVGDPTAVLPVLYHLLWLQWLSVDLSVRAGPDRRRVPDHLVVLPGDQVPADRAAPHRRRQPGQVPASPGPER
jgi:hypothetical protein